MPASLRRIMSLVARDRPARGAVQPVMIQNRAWLCTHLHSARIADLHGHEERISAIFPFSAIPCEFSFGILVMIPHSWQGLGDLQTSARTFTA